MRNLLCALLFLLGGSACGPAITVSTSKFYPPNPENCPLEFVQADMSQIAPGGEWELVGQIVLQQVGAQNPFSEEYKAIVAPRACNMGGEAVSVLHAATTSTGWGSSGSGISYAVLRHPGDAGNRSFSGDESNDVEL